MMIGNYIKGLDNKTGQPCEGIILDKVRVMVTLAMGVPGQIGNKQTIPFAVDAYLVFNQETNNLCQVLPDHITALEIMAEPFADEIDSAL